MLYKLDTLGYKETSMTPRHDTSFSFFYSLWQRLWYFWRRSTQIKRDFSQGRSIILYYIEHGEFPNLTIIPFLHQSAQSGTEPSMTDRMSIPKIDHMVHEVIMAYN